MTQEERTTLAQRRKTDSSKLRSRIKGELDLVVMKAMEKDRTRRYETANGLAADVQRFLDDQPVAAVAPSPRLPFEEDRGPLPAPSHRRAR